MLDLVEDIPDPSLISLNFVEKKAKKYIKMKRLLSALFQVWKKIKD